MGITGFAVDLYRSHGCVTLVPCAGTVLCQSKRSKSCLCFCQ